ncbi:MAG: hypothetical protein K2X11_20620 [Acetobacteraceae bacterium]|nr:hypothetical protein [Acetobacteraceae bacterium]
MAQGWSDIPAEGLLAIQQGVLRYAYRGVTMQKNPLDLALYLRLLWELKPGTVIEIGSNAGGAALWFADQTATFGRAAEVHSVDVVPVRGLAHPKVHFHQGDGRDLGAVFTPAWLATMPRPWLVIEDADHRPETTEAVLEFFAPHLRPGEWIVVEDGIVELFQREHVARHGEPWFDYGGGPAAAIPPFLARHPGRFEIARDYCDFFGRNATWNADGWLRCVA